MNATQIIDSNRIPTFNSDALNSIKTVFEEHIAKHLLETYRLPIDDDRQVLVGISGGADSAVLALFVAIYLKPHYPNIMFVFTDTGAETDSCYETLATIESITGISITGQMIFTIGMFTVTACSLVFIMSS